MENKDFAENLEKKTRDFAISIIRLSGKLPNTPEGRVVRNQIAKSGTSVGANYREKWVRTENIQPLYKECSELLAIFTSIGKKN